MKTILLSILLACAALGGCASLTNNTVQPVIVRTTCGDVPVQGATCRIINPHGGWAVTTPGSVMITKAPGDMAVDCKMPGIVGDPVLYESHATLGAYGNLLGLGIAGFTFDAYKDAAWRYSPEMTIDICRGQPERVVKQVQSIAADNGGTNLTANSSNTPDLARMQSTLGQREMKYAFAAEALAKERQCSAHPVALLNARGPATEIYTVPCNNGDTIMMKCTWGDCKAI